MDNNGNITINKFIGNMYMTNLLNIHYDGHVDNNIQPNTNNLTPNTYELIAIDVIQFLRHLHTTNESILIESQKPNILNILQSFIQNAVHLILLCKGVRIFSRMDLDDLHITVDYDDIGVLTTINLLKKDTFYPIDVQFFFTINAHNTTINISTIAW